MSGHAVILAGGASRRMGTDKLSLPRREGSPTTILAYVIDTCLQHVDAVTVLSGLGAIQPSGMNRQRLFWNPDTTRHAGPLAALADGWPITMDNVVVVAGDLPGLNGIVLRTLYRALQEATADVDGVAVVREGRMQPLLACYRPTVGDELRRAREAGEVRLMPTLAQLRIEGLDAESMGWPTWWSRPVHTPEDYEAWLASGGIDG